MDLHNYAAMAIMLIDESTQSTEGAWNIQTLQKIFPILRWLTK
jgi:hypothetical protein